MKSRITPVLYASDLSTSVRFWTEVMGFEPIIEVRDAHEPREVHLDRDGLEVIFRRVERDSMAFGPSTLQLAVADFDSLVERVSLMARDGLEGTATSSECVIREPGGNRVILARATRP